MITPPEKPRLLLVGDFCKDTGFARVLQSLAEELRNQWDICVLAVNYDGDHHPLLAHYRVYPAKLGGDMYGIGRLKQIIMHEQPDVVLFNSDPWIVARHMQMVASIPDDVRPATVAYVPVDGTGLDPAPLQPLYGLDTLVAYCDFGRRELIQALPKLAEEQVPSIPHGVDRTIFHPGDQAEVRSRLKIDPSWFVVLVIDRYDTRKRLDLAFEGFSIFAKDVPEARLWYHGAIVTSTGKDIRHLARQYGIGEDRLILTKQMQGLAYGDGIDSEQLADIYRACDVRVSTTLGEGFGLPALEIMACGRAQILPDFAAHPSWSGRWGAYWLPANAKEMMHSGQVLGRRVDPQHVADALRTLYANPQARERIARDGLDVARESRFDWSTIANRFSAVLLNAITQRERDRPLPFAVRDEGDVDDARAIIQENVFCLPDSLVGQVVIDSDPGAGAFGAACLSRGAELVMVCEQTNVSREVLAQNLNTFGRDRWLYYMGEMRSLSIGLLRVDMAQPWASEFTYSALTNVWALCGIFEKQLPDADAVLSELGFTVVYRDGYYWAWRGQPCPFLLPEVSQ